MAVDRASSDERWKPRLAGVEARRALAEVELCVTVAELADAVPHDEIEEVLHATSDQVALLIARGRALGPVPPGRLGRDAYEVAQRYAAGELTHREMIDALTTWPYVPADRMVEVDDDIGVAVDGTFSATVGAAYDDGLISGDDYDRLLVAVAGGSEPWA